MRVLVVGGGVAGPAAALALGKAGLSVTLCEAHPRTSDDIGAFLTLASNGMLALAQLDAAAAVAAAGFPLTDLSVLDASGAPVATRPLGTSQDPLTRFRCLRWRELSAALQHEVRRRGIPVRHGARLVAATEDADGVTAHFAEGDSVRADLLVGADGIGSVVRPLIDPGAAAPRYAGQRVFYGYGPPGAVGDVPAWPHAAARITMIRCTGAAFGYAVSPRGETYWFARVTGPALTRAEILAMPTDRWRQDLLSVLRIDTSPAADIVAACGDDIRAANARDLPGVRRWSTRRMLIIGDAAHAASPATGQGASMALEDAVVLAKALRDIGDREQALRDYERLRRPRVERNIETSARLTAGWRPPGPSGEPVPSPPTPGVDEERLRQDLDWETPVAPIGERPSGLHRGPE